MTAVRLNRRWLTAASAIAVIALVYFVGYRGFGHEYVPKSFAETLKGGGYFEDREEREFPTDVPTSEALGFAYYDYLDHPPTTSVSVGLPAFLTRAATSTESPVAAVTPTSQYVKPTIAPPARPLPELEYSPGNLTLNGNAYTRMLVVWATEKMDLKWLSDARKQDAMLGTKVYSTDKENNADYLPHGEPSVYLRYIIDNYGALHDITLFMQAQKANWRIDRLLNSSALDLLGRLNYGKVIRDGFVNLRCQHEPGCAGAKSSGLRLDVMDGSEHTDREKEAFEIWREFFGDQQPPTNVSQPCCGHYAVSRERIQTVPKEFYQYLYDRMAASNYETDSIRKFWDYVWQYVWAGKGQLCPREIDCYCETYGLCFEDEDELADQRRVDDSMMKLETHLAMLGPGPKEGEEDDGKGEQRKELKNKIQILRMYNGERAANATERGREEYSVRHLTAARTGADSQSRLQGVSDFFESIGDTVAGKVGMRGS